MSKFYTNVQTKGNKILLRGFEYGKRIHERIDYQPSLFEVGEEGLDHKYKTLDGRPAKRIQFNNIKEAREYAENPVMGLFGMQKYQYAFIHDNYPGTIEYDPAMIRVGYLDIEVAVDAGFPNVQEAENSITAISLRYKNHTFTVGLGEYWTSDSTTQYRQAKDENQLLDFFLSLWNKADLDVVSGWNISTFDIPYLVNRIKKVLGEDQAKRLSPWKALRDKRIYMMGKMHEVQFPLGISVLDYLDLYKKFAYTRTGQHSFKESMKLDYIANKELGEKKLDYSNYSSLSELYEKDHQVYIEYNIHDCYLVEKLNDKLKFLELVFAISYDAKVNFNDALGSVLLWDVISFNHLADKKIVIPTQPEKTNNRTIMGAYVKEPKVGSYEWVVSLDLTSLYPSLIMGYNISPETFQGKVHEFSIEELLQGGDLQDRAQIRNDVSVAANGCAYRRDKQGFLPALMEKQFAKRAEYKSKMMAAKKAGNIEETFKFDALQLAKKIQLNSAYGSLSNANFRYFDQDLAESVTYSGQLAIRWAANHLNKYLNNILGATNTQFVDFVIASDTDSLYINMKPFIDKMLPHASKTKIIDCLEKVVRESIEPKIEQWYDELAAYTNMYKNTLRMKREVIADRGIWVGKKRYILNVWDDEGMRYVKPKLKVVGIEAVRSDTPEISKNGIMSALSIIMNENEPALIKFVEEFKTKFLNAPFEQISTPTGVNNIELYFDDAKLFKKGAPIHVKAAIMYNKLLYEKNLIDKYETIYSGAKIRYCYLLTPNPARCPVIASLGSLPPEFGLEKYIDRDTQYLKTFVEPLTRITDTIRWKTEEKDTLEGLFN